MDPPVWRIRIPCLGWLFLRDGFVLSPRLLKSLKESISITLPKRKEDSL